MQPTVYLSIYYSKYPGIKRSWMIHKEHNFLPFFLSSIITFPTPVSINHSNPKLRSGVSYVEKNQSSIKPR